MNDSRSHPGQSTLIVQPHEYEPAWHEAIVAPATVILWRDPARAGEGEWVVVRVEVEGHDLMGVIDGPLPPVDEDHPLCARLRDAIADA